MSTPIFCCSSIRPYRPQYLSHENKFTSFVAWASFPTKSCIAGVTDLRSISVPFAMQLVRQVNFGPLESKRYFVPHEGTENVFDELGEDDLVQANFQKVNTYKNYKCQVHNKFFELNVYQKDTINEHHWRANLARPAREIDLQPRVLLDQAQPSVTSRVGPSTSRETKTVTVQEVHEEATGSRWSSFDSKDYEPMKDFTACDKECGYCGECDY